MKWHDGLDFEIEGLKMTEYLYYKEKVKYKKNCNPLSLILEFLHGNWMEYTCLSVLRHPQSVGKHVGRPLTMSASGVMIDLKVGSWG